MYTGAKKLVLLKLFTKSPGVVPKEYFLRIPISPISQGFHVLTILPLRSKCIEITTSCKEFSVTEIAVGEGK